MLENYRYSELRRDSNRNPRIGNPIKIVGILQEYTPVSLECSYYMLVVRYSGVPNPQSKSHLYA